MSASFEEKIHGFFGKVDFFFKIPKKFKKKLKSSFKKNSIKIISEEKNRY